MVESKKILDQYYELLNLLIIEAKYNKSIEELVKYLKNQEGQFLSINDEVDRTRQKEFIRGFNRFSDEFVFSDLISNKVKFLINNIYNSLNDG